MTLLAAAIRRHSSTLRPEHAMTATPANDPFVPASFVVPLPLDTPRFHLRPLTPAVVDLDYDALMSSIDLLRAMFGRGWPHEAFTREENLHDLVEHRLVVARPAKSNPT